MSVSVPKHVDMILLFRGAKKVIPWAWMWVWIFGNSELNMRTEQTFTFATGMKLLLNRIFKTIKGNYTHTHTKKKREKGIELPSWRHGGLSWNNRAPLTVHKTLPQCISVIWCNLALDAHLEQSHLTKFLVCRHVVFLFCCTDQDLNLFQELTCCAKERYRERRLNIFWKVLLWKEKVTVSIKTIRPQ